jgi:hypothetical protein
VSFFPGRDGTRVGVTWLTRFIPCPAQIDPTHPQPVPFVSVRGPTGVAEEGRFKTKSRDWVRAWRGSEGLGIRCRGMRGRGVCDRPGLVHRGRMVIAAGAAVWIGRRYEVVSCVRVCQAGRWGRGGGVTPPLFPKRPPLVSTKTGLHTALLSVVIHGTAPSSTWARSCQGSRAACTPGRGGVEFNGKRTVRLNGFTLQ